MEIAEIVSGELIGENVEINCVTTDSREKSDSPSCFFAIKGEKYNGSDYINDAISNGAKLIITEDNISCAASTIRVENTRLALGLLAKHKKGNIRVIGVTGSHGKTTVKDMITAVLRKKYEVCSTFGNQNNEIGVALTLLSCKNEDFCVLEMGMRGRGEIEWLSYIGEPEISVVTGCASAHIGRLGDLESIFNAKMEIIKHTGRLAVLPNEERFLRYDCKGIKKVFFGQNTEYKYTDFRLIENGQTFRIKRNDIFLESIYEHDAQNASIAYAVGEICGLTGGEIALGLSDYRKNDFRGKVEKTGDFEVINDCYNASYESVQGAIINAAKYCKFKGKKLAVLLGNMLELGEKSREYHYKIGRLCSEQMVDKMIVHGSQASWYLKGFPRGIICEKYEEITDTVLTEIDENYVLLVKASNAMNFKKIVDEIRENRNA